MTFFLLAFAVALLPTTGVCLDAKPKRLIIDTDMSTDCDDVAALCIAHALADQGLVKLLAVVHNTGLPQGVGAVSSINHYYGRDEIPIGAFKDEFGSRLPGQYVSDIVARFPGPIHNYTQVPGAVETYRSALAAQPDQSVTIASIGFMTNLAALLKSQADAHSPLDGAELMRSKVSTIVVMGGRHPSSSGGRYPFDWNFAGGSEDQKSIDPVSVMASSFFLANVPTSIEVIFDGFEVGVQIFTGGEMTSCSHVNSPCRQAYVDRQGLGNNRESWDPVAILLGIEGIASEDFLREGRQGHCVVNSTDGTNTWRSSGGQTTNQSYLVLKDGRNVSVAERIDSLLCKPPVLKLI